jgi:hypothetical protein
MIGRVVGFLFGVAIAATGYGVWRPAEFAKYVDFAKVELGDFGQYRTVLSWLIMAVGVAVALAALQRPSSRPARRKTALSLGEVESEPHPAPAPAPFAFHEESHHDGHAHDDHHDDGGHSDHGAHGAEAHEAHGHDSHDHDAHGDSHGHEDHGHGDHHAPAHAH